MPLKAQAPTSRLAATAPDPESDKEFEIKDFEKESVDTKIGYVLLGLLGAAVTAAAISVPLMLWRD